MDRITSSLNSKKHLKEEFVSNLTGSSMMEIAALSTIVPLLFLLRHAVYSNRRPAVLGSKNLGAYVATISWDFLFLVLPTLLFLTVLADWTYIAAVSLIALVFCVIANRFGRCTSCAGGSLSLREHISSYRVVVTIVTCLCILAVDFKIFPRRYAKTETYGTSLTKVFSHIIPVQSSATVGGGVIGMGFQFHGTSTKNYNRVAAMMDLGVGSFTLTNALVSRQARSVSSVNWKVAIRSTSPLLLLGFGRLLSTRSVDYQIHTGEYGVHWNFFFTLAAVSLLTSIVNISPQYSGVLGSVILVGYQSWLIYGFNKYLLSDDRGTSVISKNKEGIFSVFGYWGMYLIGVWLANYLFFENHSSTTFRSNKWARIRVSVVALICWLLTILLDAHVERVSRRMCNLAYVTLVMAQNFQVLAILMHSDYCAGSRTSALEEAFNRNLLGSFLVANVLTGLVNLSVDTLSASTLSSLFVLLLYAYTLSVIAGVAHCCGVRFKFW